MLPSLTTHIYVTSLQKKRIDAIFRYKILQAAYELHGKKTGMWSTKRFLPVLPRAYLQQIHGRFHLYKHNL